VIRFSAFLVVVAVGLLVAGVVTSKLLLVYSAIGVSGVALLALGVGAAVNWRELTGKPKTAATETSAQGSAAQGPAPAPQVVPALAASQAKPPATASAGAASTGSGWPAVASSGPSRAGYLPTEQPSRWQPPWASLSPFQPASAQPAAAQRPPAAFTARPKAPVPSMPPQPAGKPVPSRGEDAAEPPLTAERKQSPPAPPAADQAPVKDQTPVEDQASVEDVPPVKDEQPAKDEQQVTEQPSAEGQQPEKDQAPAAQTDAEHAAAAEAPATPQADQPEPAKQPEQANQPEQAEQANQAEQPEQDKPPADPEPAGPDPNLEVTVVPGVPRYHNAQCILIRFMGENDLEKMTLGVARQAGCTPCRACLPDQPDRAPE